MKQIKLKKGLSYIFTAPNGEVIKVSNKETVSVSDEAYKYAMSTGYFDDATVSDEAESSESAEAENKALKACTKQELTEIANDKGVDISACKTKAEIISAIEAGSNSSESAEADYGE